MPDLSNGWIVSTSLQKNPRSQKCYVCFNKLSSSFIPAAIWLNIHCHLTGILYAKGLQNVSSFSELGQHQLVYKEATNGFPCSGFYLKSVFLFFGQIFDDVYAWLLCAQYRSFFNGLSNLNHHLSCHIDWTVVWKWIGKGLWLSFASNFPSIENILLKPNLCF